MDLNAKINHKINHKINDKHHLYLSAYSGADIFGVRYTDNFDGGYYKTDGGIDWDNITSAARWNYMISNKLFANTTLTYSRFRFDFLAGVEQKEDDVKDSYSAKYFSGIYDWAGKVDFDYIPNPKHYIRFGAGTTHHTYEPGAFVFKAEFDGEKLDTTLGSTNTKAVEFSA